MAKTNYISCATRPEEIVICGALDAESYPKEYTEKHGEILKDINNDALRKKVEKTLGAFKTGSDGKLAQSSPYRLVVLQEIIPKGKVLVARPRLQTAKENDSNFMSGFYVGCGLNLVPSQEGYQRNKIPAEVLAGDLEKVGIKLETAKLIPYNILTYEVNTKSPSGLVFRLSKEGKDTAKSIILDTNDFKWNYQPSDSGLFRAFLYRGGDWGADYGDLAYSDGVGRVVVETTSEAGSRELETLRKKTEELLKNQKQERDSLIRKLSA